MVNFKKPGDFSLVIKIAVSQKITLVPFPPCARRGNGFSALRCDKKIVSMKNRDRVSGIILLLLGLGICWKSLTYPLGSLRRPGGGLFPLIASIFLIGLSAIITAQAFFNRDTEKAVRAPFFPEKEAPKRIFFGFAALLGYRYLMPVIGFAPATCFFIFVLSKSLGKYGWKISIFFSVATAVVAYYLFEVWLKIPMPRPMMRF
jgi:hypothetical protein